MARQISKQKILDQELTYEEARYLQQRGRLPEGYPMPEVPKASDDDSDESSDDADVSTSKSTPLEEQDIPTIAQKGGIVEDVEEEQYEDGWNNDQRRAELSKRGLSIDGRKDDLIGRLRRSDTDTLTDDDYSSI